LIENKYLKNELIKLFFKVHLSNKWIMKNILIPTANI
jgi:hypothetical protein